MPNIEIDKREFDDLVGKEIENERMIEEGSMLGAHWHSIGDDHVCDVETYPYRPDLLSVEGLARAYKGFFDIETGKTDYEIEEGDIEVEVEDSVDDVRPFIGCAVVRNLDLSRKKINGLIQLQEKLHETLGRRRDKLAIGLHDFSTIEAPFTYKAVEPEKVSFTPLEYDRDMDLDQILDKHEKGRKYAWILEDEEKYPIIEDKKGRILSFPPIINNQLTEVDASTEDVFVDVTGKNKETVLKALNILVTALSERGGDIESVSVDGEQMPDLSPEKMELDPEYFRNISGLELSNEEIVQRLEMMKHDAKVKKDSIIVEVPSYRTDIMHQYDLIEEVVIAYRYDNIEPEMPEIDQIADKSDIQNFVDNLRDVMTSAGVLEANTFYLSSKEDLFDKMDMEETDDFAQVANPSSVDQEAVRSHLMPSLFQALHDNRHHSYPQSLFEASEVVKLDDSHVGASNNMKLAFITAGDIGYTDARKVLQVLERDTGLNFELEAEEMSYAREGRSAEIICNGQTVGFICEYSDKVAENWDLDMSVAGFELDLEKLINK